MESLPFQCDQCDRGFKTQMALLAHSKVHQSKIMDAVAETVQGLKDAGLPVIETNPLSQEEKEFLSKSTLETLRDSETGLKFPPIRIKRLLHGEGLPDLKRATPGSAAFDLYAAIDTSICLGANERATPPVPTGISVEIPAGYCGLVLPRSGLANNSGISIINTPGLIDSDYRGEIKVGLVNHSRVKHWIHRGDRIAQLFVTQSLPIEIEYVNELSNTSRGTGGFGSTGV